MKKPSPSPSGTLSLTPTQLDCLASSSRLAIIQRLECDGPASARELAARLGRPTTALYHHLERLEDAGLIHVVEHRSTTPRPEAIYAAIAGQLSSVDAVQTPAGRKSLAKVAVRATGASLRAFASMAMHPATTFDGPQRNCAVRHLAFRADDPQLAQINALIDALEAAGLQAGDEGDPMLLTVLLTGAVSAREA